MTRSVDRDPVAARDPGSAAVQLLTLDRDQCLELLAGASFGRLAVRTVEGTPAIRPVNFRFDQPSQSIVFRTGRGSKLHALLEVGHAAFEVDGFDPASGTGWSVLVSGVSEEIVNRAELERLADLRVEPWAPSDKPFLVRLRAFTVSGRRVCRSAR
jgi:uncharacterized protein